MQPILTTEILGTFPSLSCYDFLFSFATSNYSHKYFIQDSLQVLPKYIVRFKLNTSPNYGISSNAPEDTDDIVFYDTTSFAPLTKAQRNNINYAAGNSSIQPIEVAFNTTVENHHQSDPMVESKKLWLDRQLESVEDKVGYDSLTAL